MRRRHYAAQRPSAEIRLPECARSS